MHSLSVRTFKNPYFVQNRRLCLFVYIKLGISSLTWDIEEVANLLDNFCRGILRPFLDELGFRSQSKETGHDRQCRATVFGYLASLRDTDIQSAAKEMFNNHINGNQPLVAGNE